MIIKQTPVVRRDWSVGTTGTDKSEGKFARLSADGQTMSLVTSASDIPDGVVSNPDGRDGADGNGGDLILQSHPGIVQVRLNDTPGTIETGTKLALCADATVKAAVGAAGEVIVAKSLAPNTSGQGDCLHEALLVARPSATPANA